MVVFAKFLYSIALFYQFFHVIFRTYAHIAHPCLLRYLKMTRMTCSDRNQHMRIIL